MKPSTAVYWALGFLLLLGLNASHYYPFYADDSLISLRYSQRLLHGQGLTWTSGIPVEGYTNFLWVVAVALVGKSGIGLIMASRILGVLCTCISGAALIWLPISGDKWERDTGRLASIAMLGMSATVGVWAIGGLEQPLVGAGLALALFGAFRLIESEKWERKYALLTGLGLVLMCLTRPDSPLFVVAIGAGMIVDRLIRKKPVDGLALAIVVGLPFLAYASQALFRHAYYGEWVPNTARVKFKPTPDHFMMGLRYLYLGFVAGFPLYVAALASLWSLYRRRQTGVFILLSGAGLMWTLYIALIGGDIFPAFRHFMPLILISAFSVALGFGGFLKSLRFTRGAVPVAVLAASLWVVQLFSPDIRRTDFERFEWQGRDLALMLRGGLGERKPVLAVTAAGCLPFWSEFDCIDMLGLNDAYIPRHPPSSFGKGLIGHELGSASYIMNRRPDLIVYNVGTMGDSFLTGKELVNDKSFLADYTPVTFHVEHNPGYLPVVWMSRYSSRIGFEHDGDALIVPGYLVNGNGASQVVATPDARLEMDVEPGLPAKVFLRRADLPQAPYAVSVVGEGPAVVTSQVSPEGGLAIRVAARGANRVGIRQLIVRHTGLEAKHAPERSEGHRKLTASYPHEVFHSVKDG